MKFLREWSTFSRFIGLANYYTTTETVLHSLKFQWTDLRPPFLLRVLLRVPSLQTWHHWSFSSVPFCYCSIIY